MSELRVAHINIRSIVPKFHLLSRFIVTYKYDIVVISETWLSANIPDDAISLQGFALVRRDRATRGGGVCIYYRSHLRATYIPCETSFEQAWVGFQLGNRKVAVGVFYNPPDEYYKSFCDKFEEQFTILSLNYDIMFCLGDININLLASGNTLDRAYFLSMLESLGLTQIINTPTRGDSLIDVILTTDLDCIVSSGIGEDKFSDHETIFCTIRIPLPSNIPVRKIIRDFKWFDQTAFLNDLSLSPLSNILYMNNIDDKIDYIMFYLLQLFDTHAPIRTITVTHRSPPWITDNVKYMMMLRDQALAKYKKTRLDTSWTYYKTLRNFTNQSIKREKKAFFNNTFMQQSAKYQWKTLKQLNVSKPVSDIPPTLQNVTEINEYFLDNIPVSTSDPELLTFYRTHRLNPNSEKFNFVPIQESELINIISEIKTKASGYDSLTIDMVKISYPLLSSYILHVINSCLLENYFPISWRKAVVHPIPKCSYPVSYGDLRPISILPVFSKILEKVIFRQLKQFLDFNRVLPDIQSGFRAGHSCTTALLGVSDDIISAIDSSRVVALTLLDFSRAFDTLDHDVLLSILHYVGLSHSTINMFHSYLANREQCVSLNGATSSFRSVVRGVPQGSILGPLLFSIYTSCFHKKLSTCSMHMYADDIQVYYSFTISNSSAAVDTINNDIRAIARVSSQHALVLNPSKSVVLLFGNKNCVSLLQNTAKFSIDGVQLPIQLEAKNLGVTFDTQFRFQTHILKCIRLAYINLKLIFPHRHFLSVATKRSLCDSLVLSHFSFCCELYGPCITANNIARIQRIQNSCLRFIFGIRKFEPITHKLAEVSWLNMADRRYLRMACLFQKIITDKQPAYLYNKISFRTDVHTLNLRFKGMLTPPLHRTALYERSFSYQIVKVYNGIPDDLKLLSAKQFKYTYKRRLLL